MTTYPSGIILRECPLCGREVRIVSGSIECICGLSFRLNSGMQDLSEWIDAHWNLRIKNRPFRRIID